jgi:hypothetical protein
MKKKRERDPKKTELHPTASKYEKATHEGWQVLMMIVGCFLSLAGFDLHLRCY